MGARGEAWHDEILGVLHRGAGPLSAYDVLGELRAVNPKIAPPTVYRALSALMERGRVHRLESINAYVACQHEGHAEGAIMSICEDCGTVEENTSNEVLSTLSSAMKKNGFEVQRQVIEVLGVCATCGSEKSSS